MPSASFGNAGAALSAYGGALKGMANKSAAAKTPLNSGSGASMSARNYRKMMSTKVEAYRQVAEIDTNQRQARLGHSTDEMLRLKGAGFHTIEHDSPDVKVRAQSEPGMPPADRAHNPSHDVHGHPGAGFSQTHGFSGDALALPGAHSNNVISVTPKSVSSSRVQPLAIESGKATDMGSQAGSRPATAQPMFKASSTDVVKAGSFMDQPAKEQPAVAPKLKTGGAIAMGSSATKGKMKGPQLQRSESGKLTEAGWDAKLSAQEGAELAKRKSKMKDTD